MQGLKLLSEVVDTVIEADKPTSTPYRPQGIVTDRQNKRPFGMDVMLSER